MFCAEWSLVKHEGTKRTITPLYCNAWSCEVCQPRRRARLYRQAADGLPDTFITLTSNPVMGDSPAERAQALAEAWRVVVRRAKAEYHYPTIPYLCVFEATKSGEPHLHILLRCKWIDQRWLSDQMKLLTNAPIVDVRRITSQRQAAAYVAKYVGKDPHHFDGTKRYWCTRDYLPQIEPEDRVPDLEPPYFSISHWNWQTLAATAQGQGYDVEFGLDWASYDWFPT